MELINQNLDKPVEFNGNSVSHLNETRKWALFISIMGFIFIGLCIVLTPFLFTSVFSNSASGRGLLTALPLMAISVIYFFPIYYLLKFSTNSKKAVTNSDGPSLELALKYLKFHYRFMGIFLIVMICLYFIGGAVLVVKNFIR